MRYTTTTTAGAEMFCGPLVPQSSATHGASTFCLTDVSVFESGHTDPGPSANCGAFDVATAQARFPSLVEGDSGTIDTPDWLTATMTPAPTAVYESNTAAYGAEWQADIASASSSALSMQQCYENGWMRSIAIGIRTLSDTQISLICGTVHSCFHGTCNANQCVCRDDTIRGASCATDISDRSAAKIFNGCLCNGRTGANCVQPVPTPADGGTSGSQGGTYNTATQACDCATNTAGQAWTGTYCQFAPDWDGTCTLNAQTDCNGGSVDSNCECVCPDGYEGGNCDEPDPLYHAAAGGLKASTYDAATNQVPDPTYAYDDVDLTKVPVLPWEQQPAGAPAPPIQRVLEEAPAEPAGSSNVGLIIGIVCGSLALGGGFGFWWW